MRLFNKFTQGINDAVMTRYGRKKVPRAATNPAIRGRASHHPLMAFIADTRMIANALATPGQQ